MRKRSWGKRAFALALAGILAFGTPVEAALAEESTEGTERIETAGAAEEAEKVLAPEEPGESAEMKKAGTDAAEEGEAPAETAQGTEDNDAGEETGAAGEIGNLDEPEGTEDNNDGAAGQTGSMDEFEGTEGAERTVLSETEVIEESETEDTITLALEKMYRSAAADFEYRVLDETAKTIEITGYRGSQTEVEIPETINGYMVTSIGFCAFDDYSGLTSVTIPEGVTGIGNYAFCDCSGLTSVTIPGSVTSIGNYAFRDCSGLTSVTIPEGVTSIGDSVFYGCSGLTSVTIPGSVTSIGDQAFWGCRGLTSVTIPEGVTGIGEEAFWGCSGLTSVTIPGSVTSISDQAFSHCTGLTSVEISEGVTSIGVCAFYGCRVLASVTIPGSVTSIGDRAFGGEELFGYYRNLTIYCMEGSYAQQYAIENNIRYQLTGTASKPETKPKDIASCTVTPAVTSCTYTGQPIQPSVTVKDGGAVLTENTDYTVAYADNIKVGTAAVTVSGKGNYEGNRKVSFAIEAKDISGMSVSSPGKQLYTGKAIKPSVTVKDGTTVLTENTDYTVAYADNIKAGTATVTVKGTGNYTGSKKVTFQIIGTVSGVKAISAGYDSVKVSWKQVSGVTGYKVYRAGSKNGKYKCVKTIKGEKTTSCKDTKLTAGKTYYYQVKPYLGKKEGSASKTVSAKPVPAETVLSSVKNAAAKTAAVKWKKVSGASGYEIYRATGRNGKYKKIATVKKGSTVSCKDTKLKKGKTYYYKVRAYRTVNGRKVYGEFSAVKSVKVKK